MYQSFLVLQQSLQSISKPESSASAISPESSTMVLALMIAFSSNVVPSSLISVCKPASFNDKTSKSTSVHGTEVLFNEKQDSIQGFNSRKFALICAEEVCAQFGLTNRGIIPRSKAKDNNKIHLLFVHIHMFDQAKLSIQSIIHLFVEKQK